jgi:hypothetical protein
MYALHAAISLLPFPSSMYQCQNYVQVVPNTAMDNLSEKVQTHLPETVLINFLLQCKELLDLQKYMNMHFTMSKVNHYHGKQTMYFLFVSVDLVYAKILVSLKQQYYSNNCIKFCKNILSLEKEHIKVWYSCPYA